MQIQISLGGGYPSILEIGFLSPGEYLSIAENWMIITQQLWISNLKIVRATNSLTISGNVVKSGSQNILNLRLFNVTSKIETGRIFTMVASVKDISRCYSDVRISRSGGNIYYHNEQHQNGREIRIADLTSSSSSAIDTNCPGIWIYPDVATYRENFTFSITIYDVACYYGAYTNPPALKSPVYCPPMSLKSVVLL